MMNAIEVNHITKVYPLYARKSHRVKEAFCFGKKCLHDDFKALDDVSFTVEQGKTVGIIGTNGSGKSTMLKIITGVLTQTAGEVITHGRISSLLELGAGFHPEYSGIENLYINGIMMGFDREEMKKKIPEIVAFSEIGDYVNQPVKNYSSGMFVRLAFSLAIHVEPEILIVDEALSVGDVFFQAKCYEKMAALKAAGTTILLVTHDMGAVMNYCDKVIIINDGHYIAEGSAGDMVDAYKKILAQDPDDHAKAPEGPVMGDGIEDKVGDKADIYGTGQAVITDFAVDAGAEVTCGETFTVTMKVRFYGDTEYPIFALTIRDEDGVEITGTNTMYAGCEPLSVKAGEEVQVTFRQRAMMHPGKYYLAFGCTRFAADHLEVLCRIYDASTLVVTEGIKTRDDKAEGESRIGLFDPESRMEVYTQESSL